jgi:hypothetical protein
MIGKVSQHWDYFLDEDVINPHAGHGNRRSPCAKPHSPALTSRRLFRLFPGRNMISTSPQKVCCGESTASIRLQMMKSTRAASTLSSDHGHLSGRVQPHTMHTFSAHRTLKIDENSALFLDSCLFVLHRLNNDRNLA